MWFEFWLAVELGDPENDGLAVDLDLPAALRALGGNHDNLILPVQRGNLKQVMWAVRCEQEAAR